MALDVHRFVRDTDDFKPALQAAAKDEVPIHMQGTVSRSNVLIRHSQLWET